MIAARPENEPSALPRKAMWFFVAGPPVMAFVFDPACLMEPGHVARAMLALWTYTVLTGLAVHYSCEWLHRRVQTHPLALRLPLHAAVASIVAVAVSLPQLPFIRFVYPEVLGQESTVVWRGVLVSLAYLAVASTVAHLQREAARERQRAHLERVAALESRLRVLQAQTQPHFLFNSLNVCAGLVHSDADGAEKTLDRLAGFLRYSLESTEQRLVTLDEELDAVRSYLEVQQQRFGDRLRFDVNCSADPHMVPPMLLQPLVENAVLHGIQSVEAGGCVTVDATQSGGELIISVENDGEFTDAASSRGTGLGHKNIRERLGLVYGSGARLDVGPTDGGGYRSTITVPCA